MKWWEKPLRILQFNIEDRYGAYVHLIRGEDLVKLALRVGANVLVLFARDPWGRVFYEGSKVGPKHPKVRGDLIKDVVREGRRYGLRVVVMVGHTANKYIFNKHREWVQVNARGEVILLEHVPYNEEGYSVEWPQICINSPYYEVIKEEVREVLRLGVDGVFLDSFRYQPDFERACYCRWCRERFRREFGYEMPEKPDWSDSRWRTLWRWRYGVVVGRIRELYELVKGVSNDVLFMYNSHPGGWAGRTNKVVEDGRDYMDFIFAECSEADHQPPGFIAEMVKLTKAMSGGRPVAASRNYFHMYRTVESSTALAVRQGLRESMISGGNLWLLMFSSAYIQSPEIIDEVRTVFKEHEALEEYLDGAESLKYVAIAVSNNTRDFYGRDNPQHYVDEVRGFYYALTHNHIPVEFISERGLSNYGVISKYKVVVLANTVCLGRDSLKALRDYVLKGGKLLVTYASTLGDEDCLEQADFNLELIPARFKGFLKTPWSYVVKLKDHELFRGIPKDKILCGDMDFSFTRSRVAPTLGWHVMVEPREGSDVVATVGLPSSDWGFEYTLGRSPPTYSHSTEQPAIIIGRVGGEPSVIYYSFQLGRHYWRLGLPHFSSLITNSVYYLAGEPEVVVRAPETVLSEVMRQGDRFIIHLLNHTYNQRILAVGIGRTKQSLPPYSSNEAVHPPRTVIPIHDVLVRVRVGEGVSYRAYLPLRNKELKYELRNGFITTELGRLDEYEVVVIEPRG